MANLAASRLELGGDLSELRRLAEWIKARTPQVLSADTVFAGLLPNALADGEFLWDGKHHILGYDFWNLRGLVCTADAAGALGLQADENELRREVEDYRRAIDKAVYELRLELAEACTKLADERGEPPLDDGA